MTGWRKFHKRKALFFLSFFFFFPSVKGVKDKNIYMEE